MYEVHNVLPLLEYTHLFNITHIRDGREPVIITVKNVIVVVYEMYINP